jgi:hypothetical protein
MHGDFQQYPDNHLAGHGCPGCRSDSAKTRETHSTEEFITAAMLVHKGLYGYEKVVYNRAREKVLILCKDHGYFKQTPNSHLMGRGCPKCWRGVSKAEDTIYNELSKITKVDRNNRSILGGKEIDLLLPEHNIGIEYNGLFWHSERVHKDPSRSSYCVRS